MITAFVSIFFSPRPKLNNLAFLESKFSFKQSKNSFTGSKQYKFSKKFDKSLDHRPTCAPQSMATPKSSTKDRALFLCASWYPIFKLKRSWKWLSQSGS